MRKEYDFEQGKRGVVITTPPTKTRITICLDDDILEWLRDKMHGASGGDFQELINRVLREYIRSKEKNRTPK